MFDRLLEYVHNASEEELPKLCIQDIAICSAWYGSLTQRPDEQAAWPDIPELVERWLSEVKPLAEQTEGRRHQTVLRAQMEVALAGKLGLLQRDEVDFILTVYDLAERASERDAFGRIRELLAPHVAALQARQKALSGLPGLPTLAGQYHVVLPEDIQRAKAREIKVFAGVEMPAQGPVFSVSGHVKVLGNVPENCIIVIEEGTCVIEGYVMGRVAAKSSCEVRENISGIVITRKGDIRCRSIINNAFVVSKLGSVFCHSALQPRLIFAGGQIRVSTTAMMGHWVSPRVHVAQQIFGGEYHVSESLNADQLRRSDARPLVVVLRRDLSGEDYGEQPNAVATRLMARGARLRERITALGELMQSIQREVEHFASGALLYICGGENTQERIQTLQRSERRLSMLDRVITGLHILSRNAEESLDTLTRGGPGSSEPAGEDSESQSFFQEFDSEFKAVESEEEVDPDLATERTEMAEANEQLARNQPDKRLTSTLLTRLRAREASWLAERERLLKSIAKMEGEVQGILEAAHVVGHGNDNATKLQLFTQMLTALKKKPSSDPYVVRAQSIFVRMMTRSISSRVERLRTSRGSRESARTEYQAVVNELRQDLLVPWGTDGSRKQRPPRATGRFDEGVRILGDPFLLDEDSAPSRSDVATPAGKAQQTVTYWRGEDGTIQTG